MRKIIHIDMDAFYASIEQRDNLEYRGKPLAVGMGEKRGVVAAASYESRQYGVRSAMPSVTALEKCPHLIFVPARFDVYRNVSRQIMEIFYEYTDLVEPLSLDEAFLDVTNNKKGINSAIRIAQEIKQKIFSITQLTASAGVSTNKFLAKIASDYKKPNGLFVILPEDAEQFVENLEIERFHGIGKVTAKKMHELGIHKGIDLKNYNEGRLIQIFGKVGAIYYTNAHAIDNREVTPNRIRKSVGAENTFDKDLITLTELTAELYRIARRVWERVDDKNFHGRTITLKIRYKGFETITRSKTFLNTVDDFVLFWDTAKELLNQVEMYERGIRLIGLSVSNLEEETENRKAIQLKLNFKENTLPNQF